MMTLIHRAMGTKELENKLGGKPVLRKPRGKSNKTLGVGAVAASSDVEAPLNPISIVESPAPHLGMRTSSNRSQEFLKRKRQHQRRILSSQINIEAHYSNLKMSVDRRSLDDHDHGVGVVEEVKETEVLKFVGKNSGRHLEFVSVPPKIHPSPAKP